jgi:hypothetical protein
MGMRVPSQLVGLLFAFISGGSLRVSDSSVLVKASKWAAAQRSDMEKSYEAV